MIYFKGILAGVAASVVVVIIFAVIAIAVTPYLPQLALRIFPVQWHQLDGAVFTPLISLCGLPIGHHCWLAAPLS